MKKRMLIIDDDAEVRASMKSVLEGVGHQVWAAADAQAARTELGCSPMDLVLLDLNLPRQSGWELFEWIKRQRPLLPIILITGMPGQYPIALLAGAAALMEKPIEVTDLLKVIDQLLLAPNETPLRSTCAYPGQTLHVSAAQQAGARPKTGASSLTPASFGGPLLAKPWKRS